MTFTDVFNDFMIGNPVYRIQWIEEDEARIVYYDSEVKTFVDRRTSGEWQCKYLMVTHEDMSATDWEVGEWDDVAQDKHTWHEWEKLGYHVLKGQRAHSFNADGKALFTSQQVALTVSKKATPRAWWAMNRHTGSHDFDGRPDHGGIGEDESSLVNGDWD